MWLCVKLLLSCMLSRLFWLLMLMVGRFWMGVLGLLFGWVVCIWLLCFVIRNCLFGRKVSV